MLFKQISARVKARFKLLKWPLTFAGRSPELMMRELPLKEKSKKSRYSFRLFRYWWASCAIREETEQIGGTLLIVDVGCERGLTKRIYQSDKSMRWIGLDWNISRPTLAEAGYDELFECNFDKRLPLPDGIADIVVCLHVLEHLPRPDFTMCECRRILRPGGLLLVGVPIKPKWAALLRESYFRRELSKGRRKKGKHINCFWPERLQSLAENLGFRTELMSGAYFLRWKGNPLENSSWWVRLNQFFGDLFPSLGSEACFSARLINKAYICPESAVIGWGYKRILKTACTIGIAACIAVVFFLTFYTKQTSNGLKCDVANLIISHQDGNDDFYVLHNGELEHVLRHPNVSEICVLADDIEKLFWKSHSNGRDSHFLLSTDYFKVFLRHSMCSRLSLVAKVASGQRQYFLLGTEGYGTPIRDI